jgi:hypothetical protein
MSDAGGSSDVSNVGLFFDQTAATFIQDEGASPIPTNFYKPSNFLGSVVNESGGNDNFPAPGPGLINYAADLTVFNGTNPNGTWKLYVVDDAASDMSSLAGGWSISLTTSPNCAAAKRPIDFNGDGKTDFQVLRNASGQINWYTLINGGAFTTTQFGLIGDTFVPSDYDGDGKADVAVWRPGSPAHFYILQSGTNTLRAENFGLMGDDPTVVGDYDGDGLTDTAAYRPGTASSQAIWFYKSSINGSIQYTVWGNPNDYPIPGDFDGDGKNDWTVQRNIGVGQAAFYRLLSGGGANGVAFGFSTDVVVPGYYDSDCKTDIAVVRGSGGNLVWYILNSTDGQVRGYAFGVSGSDYLTPGDYDGDGITDVAVWRPNNGGGQGYFFVLRSADGSFLAQNWGVQNDYPTASYNQH